MSINQDIYSSMKANAPISAIIGTRLYLLRLPQGDLGGPSISFDTKGDIPEQAHGAISVLKRVDLTLNLWSTSTLNLEDLKQAVVTYWNAYEGALGSSYVNHATLVDVGMNYDDETKLYQSVLLIDIHLRN
tara:strand:- start:7513 stop:7905 length:393 start_codon:yes stop_codon:yes gene_type:complete